MGRASRKGGTSELREHWSETHPDRHLWTEAQRVHAQMQTQAEYEALYGRGKAVASASSMLEDPEGYILLRERGQYSSSEDARSGGIALPLVQAEQESLRITSLVLHNANKDIHSFAFNEYQMQHFLSLVEEHFPGRDDLPLARLWREGGDLFGGQESVAGAFQEPHVSELLEQKLSSLQDGDMLSLDTESHLQVQKEDDQFTLIFRGQGTVFSSPAGVTERALVQGQGNDFIFSPRLIRQSDPFSGSQQFLTPDDPLVLVAERGSARLWANRNGCFVLDTDKEEALLGWMQRGRATVALREPAELDADASQLLVQFLHSARSQNG